ncbi:MAG TPA: PAS domain-containing protein, partial [Burkholderiales bacterium]|nr:PAS domain-containing protein [Burkholderiales bacterium]
MSEAAPRRELAEANAALRPEATLPPLARSRHALEYEALLANASIGIAFTRERRFFLTNPKFAEMFGYGPDEL